MKIICVLLSFIFFFLNISAQLLSPVVDSIPMRDNKKLAADIYMPDGGISSLPTILIKTPYNRLFYRFGLPLGINTNLAGSNYNFVIVDWRGFYGSTNALAGNPKIGEDGYDVVEWIAQQSWSNGKVGFWGPSALGRVQYLTMKENPPHLVCCVPLVAAPYYDYNEYYQGGVKRVEYLQQLDALGYGISLFVNANPYYNIQWQWIENEYNYPSSISQPCLLIGGWYDHNIEQQIKFFNAIRLSSNINVRNKHKLLVGPWAHGGFGQAQVGTCTQGEMTYNEACGWSDSLAMRFFDYYLRDISNNWETEPNVLYFQPGKNEWMHEATWPPQVINNIKLYFSENENLQLNTPNGLMNSELIYNPKDPSPSHGGATLRNDLLQGPYDQSQIVESRNDLLSFTSEILQNEFIVNGKPYVKIFVESDRLDTDFAVRLCDVFPDGKSILLQEGIKRARFRNGYSLANETFMSQSNIYEIIIDLPDIAYTFMPGHKIRVNISSSNYPRFDRNLNNGSTLYAAGDTLTAINKIYHGNNYYSYINLPSNLTSNNSIITQTNKHYNIYPNPFSDKIYIEVFDSSVNKISIFDCLNNLIEIHNLYTNCINIINLNHFKDGIYFIKFNDNNYKTNKLVKIKQ